MYGTSVCVCVCVCLFICVCFSSVLCHVLMKWMGKGGSSTDGEGGRAGGVGVGAVVEDKAGTGHGVWCVGEGERVWRREEGEL